VSQAQQSRRVVFEKPCAPKVVVQDAHVPMTSTRYRDDSLSAGQQVEIVRQLCSNIPAKGARPPPGGREKSLKPPLILADWGGGTG
jgi:hypothetical protein